MFTRTTCGQGRSNGGHLLRVENVVSGSTSALIVSIKMQAEKYFLGAVSVIYGPVICQFSSAGKHFVWNTYEINMDILFAVCGLTWISTEDYFFVIPYCNHS